MLPNTKHSLEKLEFLLKSLGYRVRYEKGNFRTGACTLKSDKVLVINKFSDLGMRINALIVLLRDMQTDGKTLDDKQRQFLGTIKQTKLTI